MHWNNTWKESIAGADSYSVRLNSCMNSNNEWKQCSRLHSLALLIRFDNKNNPKVSIENTHSHKCTVRNFACEFNAISMCDVRFIWNYYLWMLIEIGGAICLRAISFLWTKSHITHHYYCASNSHVLIYTERNQRGNSRTSAIIK